jgi:hypothetical protein
LPMQTADESGRDPGVVGLAVECLWSMSFITVEACRRTTAEPLGHQQVTQHSAVRGRELPMQCVHAMRARSTVEMGYGRA